jgi:hypothetical protein
MPDQERLEFVRAFASKPAWSTEDSEIVDFLMEVGSPEIRSGAALLLLKERDRGKALSSLLRCVAMEHVFKANYYQALAYLQDRSALTPLVEVYRSYREQLNQGGVATAEKQALIDYLCCARAVLSLGGPPECKSSIEELRSHHPSPEIREFAARILQRPGDPWPW